MFIQLLPSPDLRVALASLRGDLAVEVHRIFAEYARLKESSAIEHEALCGVLDTLHIRLDDLPRNRDGARDAAIRLTTHAVEGLVLSTDAGMKPDLG